MYVPRILAASALALAAPTPTALASDSIFELHPIVNGGVHEFGRSCEAAAGLAIVGAPGNNSAYSFDLTTGARLQRLRSVNSTFGDRFGRAVATDGQLAVVGAPRALVGATRLGRVYVLDPITGAELAMLESDLPYSLLASPDFGISVAIEGDRILVGQPRSDLFPGGVVHVFETATFTRVGYLSAPQTIGVALFGSSLDVDQGVVVVGAPRDSLSAFEAGAAYLFDLASLSLLDELVPSDLAPFDRAGTAVAISGGRAVVGSPGESTAAPTPGAAYLFDVATGQQVSKLDGLDQAGAVSFGGAVDIEGTTIAVGDADAHAGEGAVWMFRSTTGLLLRQVSAPAGASAAEFGSSVALGGNFLVAGAPLFDDQVVDEGVASTHCVSCPGVNYCIATVNSTGAPATIGACGGLSVAGGTLALVAHSIPSQPYLFFGASNQVQLPFGDGFQCAGGSIVRLHTPNIATGEVVYQPIDLAALGLGAPQTLNVQGWFRDPAAGGAGWNLTDGLTLDLVP